MNWLAIEANWKQFKGRVKEHWGRLVDDDLDTIAGRRDRLKGQLQATYGITEEQAENQVKSFEELHRHYQPATSAESPSSSR